MNEILEEGEKKIANRDESKIAAPATLPMSEVQNRIAHEHPRDEKKVFTGSLQELMLNPEYASEAYYSIPYKDKRGGTKITNVEGLSIKAAMSLARRWGNCANGARIADERDERIICQGMFFDYETNTLTLRDVSVSKWFRTREGQMIKLDAQRLNMAIMAGQSKAVRNAITATLPAYLREAYFKMARDLVINPPSKDGKSRGTIKERIDNAKAHFITKLGATKEELEALISEWVADADGNLAEDEILARLIGLNNAIKENHITIDAAMGRSDKPVAGMPTDDAA